MIDSGATMYLSPVKSEFIDLQLVYNPEQVRIAGGDTKMRHVKGYGTVVIYSMPLQAREYRTLSCCESRTSPVSY